MYGGVIQPTSARLLTWPLGKTRLKKWWHSWQVGEFEDRRISSYVRAMRRKRIWTVRLRRLIRFAPCAATVLVT